MIIHVKRGFVASFYPYSLRKARMIQPEVARVMIESEDEDEESRSIVYPLSIAVFQNFRLCSASSVEYPIHIIRDMIDSRTIDNLKSSVMCTTTRRSSGWHNGDFNIAVERRLFHQPSWRA
jgi:hypothetical protein